uniref:Fractalkine n=1 Tax=Castor canadensis TaxID=51338 RepID=A0A8C0WG37_CASCN
MAPRQLAWLLRLAAFCHLTILLAAWRRGSTNSFVLTQRSHGCRTP